MLNQILADYYEEKGFINKSLRLRNHKPLVIYGWYNQYIDCFGIRWYYRYNTGCGKYDFSHLSEKPYYWSDGFYYGYYRQTKL